MPTGGILSARLQDPMRLAWFTPLPPVRSGVSLYSAELLPRLRQTHAVDTFVDTVPRHSAVGTNEVFSAHDFIWKHASDPYDLVVYQLGNSPCHDYMWPYLVRYPGLTTLHDGQLHHARGRCLLRRKREDDYRSEFRFNHPAAHSDVTELGIAGLLGSLTYLWPMRRVVVTSSRLLVVHDSWLAEEIGEELPDAQVEVVAMGVPELPAAPEARETVLARHGIPSDAVLFAAFGKITPEKRISQALQAIAGQATEAFPLHVLLCGEPVDHYDARTDAQRLGISDRVTVTGYIDDRDMPDYIAAADVCLSLRWPSARETSASWLRCLAAGKPTIVTDLAQLAHIPAWDPRDWSVAGYAGGRDGEGNHVRPACIGIDILDEDHSLTLAVRRLVTDPELRNELGRGARVLWESSFTLDQMVAGYERVLEKASRVDAPDRAGLPPHLLTDGTERAKRLLARMGMQPSELDMLDATGSDRPAESR